MLSRLDSHFEIAPILCYHQQLLFILAECTNLLLSGIVYLPFRISSVTHSLLVKKFGEKSKKKQGQKQVESVVALTLSDSLLYHLLRELLRRLGRFR